MLGLKLHNVSDYLAATFLLFAPFAFAFADVTPARNVFLFAGFALCLSSLLTNYEYSLARVLPLGAHMTFDAALGVLLMVAPFAFDYREALNANQEYLHYVAGFTLLMLVGVTNERSEDERRSHRLVMRKGPARNWPAYPGQL